MYLVRLRHGAADLPRFDAAASADGGAVYTQNEDAQVASVEASIHPQAIGWWLLAPLAALVGLAVIGQALGRQSIAESEDFPTMVALGTSDVSWSCSEPYATWWSEWSEHWVPP